ncbi:MAG: hypothetical protein U5M23_14235 [Marinagarivorans sp.]|nr:hypothetical protein [Marinagarivorans sp.]
MRWLEDILSQGATGLSMLLVADGNLTKSKEKLKLKYLFEEICLYVYKEAKSSI